jgi:hypothetical protein
MEYRQTKAAAVGSATQATVAIIVAAQASCNHNRRLA